jgi:peptidyl-prolyl cis-trans isomerase C
MRMNRTPTLLLALLAVAAISGFSGAAKAETAPDTSGMTMSGGDAASSGKTLKDVIQPNTVYATVDGSDIKGSDIQSFITKLPPQLQAAPADKLLGMIVNQMVNDKLVAKEAAKEGLDKDPEVAKRVDDAKAQVIRDVYVEKQLKGKVTDAAVKAKYDDLVKNTPPQDEIRASHILVKDEATAKDIIKQLHGGAKFADLAKKYSIDPTKENGGDLGYFVRGAMVKEFGDAVFSMKKGETTKEPVHTQFGYHVIKVVDRRPQEKPPFDKVKDQIKAQLTDEQIRDIVKNLRDSAKVELKLPKQ